MKERELVCLLLFHLLRDAHALPSPCTVHQQLGTRDLPTTAAEQKTRYLEAVSGVPGEGGTGGSAPSIPLFPPFQF